MEGGFARSLEVDPAFARTGDEEEEEEKEEEEEEERPFNWVVVPFQGQPEGKHAGEAEQEQAIRRPK